MHMYYVFMPYDCKIVMLYYGIEFKTVQVETNGKRKG